MVSFLIPLCVRACTHTHTHWNRWPQRHHLAGDGVIGVQRWTPDLPLAGLGDNYYRHRDTRGLGREFLPAHCTSCPGSRCTLPLHLSAAPAIGAAPTRQAQSGTPWHFLQPCFLAPTLPDIGHCHLVVSLMICFVFNISSFSF